MRQNSRGPRTLVTRRRHARDGIVPSTHMDRTPALLHINHHGHTPPLRASQVPSHHTRTLHSSTTPASSMPHSTIPWPVGPACASSQHSLCAAVAHSWPHNRHICLAHARTQLSLGSWTAWPTSEVSTAHSASTPQRLPIRRPLSPVWRGPTTQRRWHTRRDDAPHGAPMEYPASASRRRRPHRTTHTCSLTQPPARARRLHCRRMHARAAHPHSTPAPPYRPYRPYRPYACVAPMLTERSRAALRQRNGRAASRRCAPHRQPHAYRGQRARAGPRRHH